MNKPVYIVYQIIQTNKKTCFWRIKKRNHKTKTKTKIINKQLPFLLKNISEYRF